MFEVPRDHAYIYARAERARVHPLARARARAPARTRTYYNGLRVCVRPRAARMHSLVASALVFHTRYPRVNSRRVCVRARVVCGWITRTRKVLLARNQGLLRCTITPTLAIEQLHTD